MYVYMILRNIFICDKKFLNYIDLTFFILKTVVVYVILNPDSTFFAEILKLHQIEMVLWIYTDLLPFIYDNYKKINSFKDGFYVENLFNNAYLGILVNKKENPDNFKIFFKTSNQETNPNMEELFQKLTDMEENMNGQIKEFKDAIKNNVNIKMIKISETNEVSELLKKLFIVKKHI